MKTGKSRNYQWLTIIKIGKMQISDVRETRNLNPIDKITFNNRLILIIEVANKILIEVIEGRRFKVVTYLALNKKFLASIANARELPIITIYTHTTNYYNVVAHSFASLCAQYFTLEIVCFVVLFRVIQSMKMLLRTSCSGFENYYLGNNDWSARSTPSAKLQRGVPQVLNHAKKTQEKLA